MPDRTAVPALSLDELRSRIGNTPMRRVRLQVCGRSRDVYLKLEGENPGGSIKDRTALALVDALDAAGLIHADTVLVESTSGNLGVAAAMIARARGLRFVAVIDPKTTAENVEKLRALGAEMDLVSERDAQGGYLLSRLARVQALCARSRRYVWLNQYGSPANPSVHRNTTAAEIHRQVDGRIDAIFAAVSTGGTLAGIAEYFRTASPATSVIGVDALGSVALGGQPGARELTGIGSSRPSEFITRGDCDGVMYVPDRQAFAFCRELAETLGVYAGGSSGAVLAACARYLAHHPEALRVVCICADRGENYATSIFDDRWLASRAPGISKADLGPYCRFDPPLSQRTSDRALRNEERA